MNKKKVWIIVDHPQQLITALAIFKCLDQKVKVNLLISKHEYWKKYNLNKYLHFFSKVFWFERYDYPPPYLNIVKQIGSTALNFYGLFITKLKLEKIGINKEDIIIGLSLCQFLENLVISTFKENKSISIMPQISYQNENKKPKKYFFEYSLGSLMTKTVQKMFGMNETIFMHRKNVKEFGDGDIFLGYKEKLEKVYDHILIMNNIYDDDFKKNKIKNVISITYPSRFGLTKKSTNNKMKKVVYLGDPFLKSNNLPPHKYLIYANKCLDYVRKNFSKKYSLIYYPHPRETKESSQLNLTRFNIQRNKKPVEFYFLEEGENISAIFSVFSTASRFALNFGINSYIFYPVFPFDLITIKDIKNFYGAIPSNSVIKNLKNKPKELKLFQNDRNISFGEYLKKIILSN